MARLDQDGGNAASPEILDAISRLEGKPTKVVHHRPIFGGCGCCSGLFGIFIIIAIVILGLVARTGLVQVPVLSAVLYHTPAPSRVVAPAKTAGLVPQRTADGHYRVVLTEADLTATLQQTFATLNEQSAVVTLADGQMAVNDGTIEVFATFSRPAGGSVQLVLVPVVLEHQLQFQLQSVRLGALALPRWFGAANIERAINQQISEIFSALPFTVDSVSVRAGAIEVLLAPVNATS